MCAAANPACIFLFRAPHVPYAAPANFRTPSKSEDLGAEGRAAFSPDGFEALQADGGGRGIVQAQARAWLGFVETDQSVCRVDDDQGFTQRLHAFGNGAQVQCVRVTFGKTDEARLVAVQVRGAFQGNADLRRRIFGQSVFERIDAFRPGEAKRGEVAVENAERLAKQPENPGTGGVEFAPAGTEGVEGVAHGRCSVRWVELRNFWEVGMPVGVIEALDHEARGIARQDGKAIFVEGALPGETVEYASFRRKPNYEQAHLLRVMHGAATRVPPVCPHFGVCGGCVMQHLEFRAQVAVKQRILEDNLWHIGRLRPDEILPPIQGPAWGYRHKARLGVRKVPKKGGILVGFHERKSSYIADIRSCPVLHPAVSALLLPLRELIGSLSISERLPQIEVAVGEACVALVLRILEPLVPADETCLKSFADQHGVVFYLQPKGPDSARRFYPLPGPELAYHLPEFGLRMAFRPTDFTQVNHAINRVLIRRALELLDPQPDERIVDLFSGLGNFTLPIARRGARVLGVEGSAALVERGRECAALNGLAERADFAEADLFACTPESLLALGAMDKLFIDPPREGALEVVKSLPETDAPARIVYVSCNPATLARDAAILVSQKGYRCRAAGAVNMFPHTAHVESIALFER